MKHRGIGEKEPLDTQKHLNQRGTVESGWQERAAAGPMHVHESVLDWLFKSMFWIRHSLQGVNLMMVSSRMHVGKTFRCTLVC